MEGRIISDNKSASTGGVDNGQLDQLILAHLKEAADG